MMRKSLLHLFVSFLLVSSFAGGEAPKPEDPYRPPAGSLRLCGGHVAGALKPDGSPGPHITWDAYTSTQSVESLVKHYMKSLGPESDTREEGCHSWKMPKERPVKILQVCSKESRGVWSDCDRPPGDAAGIILISTMARTD